MVKFKKISIVWPMHNTTFGCTVACLVQKKSECTSPTSVRSRMCGKCGNRAAVSSVVIAGKHGISLISPVCFHLVCVKRCLVPLYQILHVLLSAALSGHVHPGNTLERGIKTRPLQNTSAKEPVV